MADTATITWQPHRAWAGILRQGHLGASGTAGVSVVARDGLGIAVLIASEDGEAALAQAVKARFGLALPSIPMAACAARHRLVWAGPGQWLLIAEERTGFADDLCALSALAAVSDHSDARAGLTLSGPRLREALAKGCMLDLHTAAFPVGTAALTGIAHIGVHLWRIDDNDEGAVFELVVPRSLAGSFWSWFSASAAEFGCTVTATRRDRTPRADTLALL